MWILVWVGVMSAVAFIYILYVGVSAFLETQSAPRKPMVLCEKHGPMLEEHMIDFMGQKVCSLCFHNTMRDAERAGQVK